MAVICSAYGQVKPEQEAFQRLAVVALEDFSDAVLVDMVNPKTGIISSFKFPPSIAEMVDWCRSRTYELAPPVPKVNVALLPSPDFTDDERSRMLARRRAARCASRCVGSEDEGVFDNLHRDAERRRHQIEVLPRDDHCNQYTSESTVGNR